MAGRTQANKYVVEKVLQKGWDFLYQNFENFTTSQKIQIALELGKKSMPSEHNFGGEVIHKHIVTHEELEERTACFSPN